MATDVEETDTDEYERSAPPKRQCTRFSGINGTSWSTEQHASINIEAMDDSTRDSDHDKMEYLRDKLKRWQAYQTASVALDNTVNKVLENMMSPSNRLNRDCFVNSMTHRLRTFHGYYMEMYRRCLRDSISFHRVGYMEEAVMMAIRNYGLVKTAKLISQPHNDDEAATSGCRSDSEHVDTLHCSSSSCFTQKVTGSLTPIPTTSSEPPRLINSIETGRCNMSDADAVKTYDSDQPEDFLERAVAEAIKKKGLSALSVQNY